MEHHRSASSLDVHIEMGLCLGLKHDEVPWPCIKHQARLMQANFSSFELPDCENGTVLLVANISMAFCADTQIDDK